MTEIKGSMPFDPEDLKWLEENPGRVYDWLDPEAGKTSLDIPAGVDEQIDTIRLQPKRDIDSYLELTQ